MSSPLSHLHLHIALPQEVRVHLGGAEAEGAVLGGPDEVGSGAPASYALVGDGVQLLTAEQRDILADTASLLAGEVVRVVRLPKGCPVMIKRSRAQGLPDVVAC